MNAAALATLGPGSRRAAGVRRARTAAADPRALRLRRAPALAGRARRDDLPDLLARGLDAGLAVRADRRQRDGDDPSRRLHRRFRVRRGRRRRRRTREPGRRPTSTRAVPTRPSRPCRDQRASALVRRARSATSCGGSGTSSTASIASCWRAPGSTSAARASARAATRVGLLGGLLFGGALTLAAAGLDPRLRGEPRDLLVLSVYLVIALAVVTAAGHVPGRPRRRVVGAAATAAAGADGEPQRRRGPRRDRPRLRRALVARARLGRAARDPGGGPSFSASPSARPSAASGRSPPSPCSPRAGWATGFPRPASRAGGWCRC